MKKILLAFGTRPEAVKMCPLALALRQREGVKTVICLTGQHGELVSPVLEAFGLAADHDLRIMTPEQSLFDVTESVLRGMRGVLEAESFLGRLPEGISLMGLYSYGEFCPVGDSEWSNVFHNSTFTILCI